MKSIPTDYLVNPQGYSGSLTKREHFALTLTASLLAGGMRPSSAVMRAGVLLADNLIEQLNSIKLGTDTNFDLDDANNPLKKK